MKKLKFLKILSTVALIFPFIVTGYAQNHVQTAKALLQEKSSTWNLETSDIQDVLISDSYLTKHNGVKHVYFQQTVNGIPIYNSITGVHVDKDGKAHTLDHRFISSANSLVTSSEAKLTEEEAIHAVASNLNIESPEIIEIETQYESGVSQKVFEGANLSHEDIKVKPIYVYHENELRLAWDLAVDVKTNADYLSYRIDAATGDVLDIHNWTTYCQFDHDHSHCGSVAKNATPELRTEEETESMIQSGSYRVFELPAESPSHGPHVVVSQPHIVESSPFGWHDVSGDGNPDYTITRGNNVHAWSNAQGFNTSRGDEPDGGAGLVFDYQHDPNNSPVQNEEAATVNLFYTANMVHDVSYLFGFDEAAGNFQVNNHSKGGAGNDYVVCQALDSADTFNPPLNNANFSTPPDGGRGRMRMYVWNSGGSAFTVTEPSDIAKGYTTSEASFGPSILTGNIDITASVVQAMDDDISNPTFACDDLINANDIKDKIALVDRGGCAFDRKVKNCEEAGAVAVIICNFAPDIIGMGASGEVIEPKIPSFMINSIDCATIKAKLSGGVVATIKSPEGQLQNLDGDLDNGIIAHEYGHGISNRLTAGPSRTGCLGNAEQMGEGWSDFFSLILTTKEGDQGTDRRGIGTYASRQPTNGPGIRPRPYSTDFDINEATYSFVARSEISQPHGIGFVWCTMIWDLYWALVEEYGFDSDFKNANAGNNIAIQLVMDGMKLQPCQPGFVDGRDAILLADTMNNGGVNSCLIWEVFAKRGLGFYADQGSSMSRSDGVENFETSPLCQNQLRIRKDAPTIVVAGDTITYTISIENNKTSLTNNVVVKDLIPVGCTYVDGSATTSSELNGNTISFEIGNMNSLQKEVIQYKVVTGPQGSATLWIDDLENGRDNWIEDLFEGFTIWELQEDFAHSPESAYYTENADVESDQILTQTTPVRLNIQNPGMRFFHQYSTSAPTSGRFSGNIDGGVLEISEDGTVFRVLKENDMIRNGYTGPLAYNTFTLPNLFGFYGNSNGFVDTYVDLEQFKDKDVYLRFRFGTMEEGIDGRPLPPPAGWVIDDIEYLDLKFYKTPATVTSDDGDNETAELPGKGTLVEPNTKVGATDIPEDIAQLLVYPNPVSENLKIKVDLKQNVTSEISLFTIDGKMIKKVSASLKPGVQIIEIPVEGILPGNYMLEMTTEKGRYSQSWIKI